MRAKTAALIVALVIEIILLVIIGVVAVIVNTLLGFGLGSVFFFGPVSLAFWLILLIIAIVLIILIVGTIIALVASAAGDRRRRKEKELHGEAVPVKVKEEKSSFWHQDLEGPIDVTKATDLEVQAADTKAEAVKILDERYARGEITRDDYLRMREDIKGKEESVDP